MSKQLLALYHRSPAWLRTVAASARGYQLRARRYGAETEQLVAQALERERWSIERQREWQRERLSYILHRAATRVPYYRDEWSKRRQKGDRASSEYLENWSVLEKESLRENPRAFVADDCDVRRMFYDYTSGTTGKPVGTWASRNTLQAWYALAEARWRRWYGVSLRDRWAIIGGQVITAVEQRRPPFWVWNASLKQLYMSCYHIAPDLTPHYADALRRYKVKYILGYTSSLYALAHEIVRTGRRDVRMEVVITNAEQVYAYQREVIAEAFQCPVRETYGMSEMIVGASECEAEQLHLWTEAGVVEVFERGQPAPRGISGELICTGLVNADMPLIRYRAGDRVALSEADDENGTGDSCACGRTLPALKSVEGRMDDLLYTADGRCVTATETLYEARLPVREAQIIQERLDRVRVRFVPTSDYTPAAGDSIIEGMRARMGAIEVVLEEVDEIPRGANGKFRAVVCELPAEVRERALNGAR